MVNINNLIAFEEGELDESDTIELFQEMINDGSVWRLQGSYGRMATWLIHSGLCATTMRVDE